MYTYVYYVAAIRMHTRHFPDQLEGLHAADAVKMITGPGIQPHYHITGLSQCNIFLQICAIAINVDFMK